MSTRTTNFNTERGHRLQTFRLQVAGLEQKEVAEKLDVSQAKISMIEKGQLPTQDIMEFYDNFGINWHWVFTGDGPMRAAELSYIAEPSVTYDMLRGSIGHLTSTEPIDVFFIDIDKLKTEVLYKIRATNTLSPDEVRDLKSQIVKKIREKTAELIKHY